MIVVIVPAHNEQDTIGACLESILVAASHSRLNARSVHVVVVLDACTDATADVAASFGVTCLTVQARCVGAARALGASHAIALGATWLAFTDADSTVAPEWLADQVALGGDAVCGTVSVRDWHIHPQEVRHRYEAHYRDFDGHRHIHGANLGVSSAAYLRAGGFPSVTEQEDVALVRQLVALNADIKWSAAPRVATSVRLANRVAGGFGGFVAQLYEELQGGIATAP